MGFCGIFEHFPRFEFFLLPSIVHARPRTANANRWAFGYIAQKYPDKVEKSIPKLLENLKDKSTVVRWCAAFALTEIAKHNHEKQEELVNTINKLIKTEQNSGVRNLYIKALKEIEKL